MLLAAITHYPLYLWLGAVTRPGNIDYATAIFIIFILVCDVGMVYGPVGALLAEFFPGRIRYTLVSVPYHIGNGWGGGLVPFITSAAFAATGSVGYALIYPIAVPAVCFVLALFLMPETRAMAGGDPAGRAAAAGGRCSWADEPTLAANTETPRTTAIRRRPGASMIVATYRLFWSPVSLNARLPQSICACHCGFATQVSVAAACMFRQIPSSIRVSSQGPAADARTAYRRGASSRPP
jgi:hypothetical protein